MKEVIAKLLLKLLANITAEQYKTALQHVANAAQTAMDSVNKRGWVIDNLKAQWPKLSNWAVNLLTEVAVGVFKNKQ